MCGYIPAMREPDNVGDELNCCMQRGAPFPNGHRIRIRFALILTA
jgi:hypothetical protein